MRNGYHGAVFEDRADRALDQGVRVNVHRRRRLVKNEDLHAPGHSAGKAQHLLLAGAQVFVRDNKAKQLCSGCEWHPFLQCWQQVAHLEGTKQGRVVLHAEWVEVLAHSASEQRGVLRDGGEARSKVLQRHRRCVDVVNEHRTANDRDQAEHGLQQCALAAPRAATHTHFLARLDLDRHVLEDVRQPRAVLRGQVAELDRPARRPAARRRHSATVLRRKSAVLHQALYGVHGHHQLAAAQHRVPHVQSQLHGLRQHKCGSSDRQARAQRDHEQDDACTHHAHDRVDAHLDGFKQDEVHVVRRGLVVDTLREAADEEGRLVHAANRHCAGQQLREQGGDRARCSVRQSAHNDGRDCGLEVEEDDTRSSGEGREPWHHDANGNDGTHQHEEQGNGTRSRAWHAEVEHVCVLREPSDDASGGSRVEEGHRGMQRAPHHLVVDRAGGVDGTDAPVQLPHEHENGRGDDSGSVDGEVEDGWPTLWNAEVAPVRPVPHPQLPKDRRANDQDVQQDRHGPEPAPPEAREVLEECGRLHVA